MKKISALVLVLLCFGFKSAFADEYPLVFDNTGSLTYEAKENDNSLIDTSSMKKGEKIEDAIEMSSAANQKPIIEPDRKRIRNELLLQFQTKHLNSIPSAR